MKTILLTFLLFCSALTYAADSNILFAQMEPKRPVDMQNAKPRMMGLYEQGWSEGVKVGEDNSGKAGWFCLGFGNLPLMWLPWVVEPRHPAKPPIQAEEEFNSGFKNGHRAGWKNVHKTYYIAGSIVETAIIGGFVIANNVK